VREKFAIINDSAAHCPNVLKFDTVVQYGARRPRNCENLLPVKKIQDGGRRQRPIQIELVVYKSGTDRLTDFKLGIRGWKMPDVENDKPNLTRVLNRNPLCTSV